MKCSQKYTNVQYGTVRRPIVVNFCVSCGELSHWQSYHIFFFKHKRPIGGQISKLKSFCCKVPSEDRKAPKTTNHGLSPTA